MARTLQETFLRISSDIFVVNGNEFPFREEAVGWEEGGGRQCFT